MRRGEVWWVEHPELGRRPACILTRDEAIPVLRSILVAPATRTARRIRTEVALEREDGVPVPCVLSLDNLWTVSKRLIVERIAELPDARMLEVCQALRIATGC